MYYYSEKFPTIADLPANYKWLIRMWSDGSCWPQHGPGGWAARIDFCHMTNTFDFRGISFASLYVWGRQAGLMTNQTAEMNAIRDGLAAIPAHIEANTIELICDSEWAIRILKGEYRKKMYLSEWKIIEDGFARFAKPMYTHIRGHQDRHQYEFGTIDYDRVVGNNICDEISGWARTTDDISDQAFRLQGFI